MRAKVRVHDATVGKLELTGDLTVFRFDPAYLAMPERPTLGRWFEDRLTPDLVVKGPHSQLPPFFQNYLPERGSALRELLARRAGVSTNRELSLLCALGEDLPGAVVVERGPTGEDPALDGEAPPESDHKPSSGPLRFSLAGMQLKLSVLKDETHYTFPVTGVGGRWILKIPTPSLPGIAENEHAMMRWAKRAGIIVPDVHLIRLGDVVNLPEGLANPEERGLLVERFDRPRDGGPRVHQEDFAQVLGVAPTDKYGRSAGVTYDRLGKIIATLSGPSDFEEFVRRLVFNLLCQNPDAHLKNWSFWYPDRRRPRLSPAYDLVSAAIYPSIHKELACRLANEWDPNAVRASHFGKLASRAGFDATWGVALAEAAATRIREAWKVVDDDVPMPEGLQASLEKHLSATRLP